MSRTGSTRTASPRAPRRRRRYGALVIGCAVVASAAVVAIPGFRYFWIALAWAAVCLWAMPGGSTSARRALWFNSAVLLVALAVLEGFVELTDERVERRQVWSNPENIFQRDDVLGHRPPADHHTACKLYYGEELVYDVEYTIDADGLRIGPPARPGDPDRCVLFFGGSYTFGEGVDDDQTMAYLVGERSGYRVRNFGFSGYGPHQMLAAIESGFVERAAHCEPEHAIYQSHPHHVVRAAGKWWWDKHGPRYVLTDAGNIRREGNFGDGLLDGLLDESAAVNRLRDNIMPNQRDLELFHAIVQQARTTLEKLYPGIAFHVLHWDVGVPHLFTDPTEAAGLSVHRLSEIFPEREGWEGVYTYEHDVHPTPLAHSIMADYVVEHILDEAAVEEKDATVEEDVVR